MCQYQDRRFEVMHCCTQGRSRGIDQIMNETSSCISDYISSPVIVIITPEEEAVFIVSNTNKKILKTATIFTYFPQVKWSHSVGPLHPRKAQHGARTGSQKNSQTLRRENFKKRGCITERRQMKRSDLHNLLCQQLRAISLKFLIRILNVTVFKIAKCQNHDNLYVCIRLCQ